MKANTSRPELPDMLEPYGRMAQIGSHQFKAAIRQLLHVGGQRAIVMPEVW
ncbi:MAG TPA: hypothetical protein PKE27_19685 [Povalibacter sp.]|nr:hypothetical protein [Povalibacter sp.]